MRMTVLYFSGTGNSRFIADRFAEKMDAECHSIEEKTDFSALLHRVDTVAVVYPIYGSCVPRIMREFVERHMEAFKEKKLIIFCTQMMFSGDGARAFARLIPHCEGRILYAEHFNMPNNICNFRLFPMNEKELVNKPKKAEKRLDEICEDIRNGVVKKRGWNAFSTLLGRTQNVAYPRMEEKARHSFHADDSCTKCGLCVRICPMNNLEIVKGQLVQKDNCTVCYRCVNACPRQAATVYLKAKPKRQYKGFDTDSILY